jgi:hypothetical protein
MKRILYLVNLTLLIFNVSIDGQNTNPQADHEYDILNAFTGNWHIYLEARDSLNGPLYKVEWTLIGQRVLRGYFLETKQVWKAKGIETNGIELAAYDPIKKTCISNIGYDDGSRIYSTWAFVNDSTIIEHCTNYYPDGKVISFRNTWIFSADRMSLTFNGEDKKDGTWWTSCEGKGVKSK